MDDAVRLDGQPWVPVPLVRGRRGAVVAPHHLATEAGLSVLRQGGSAVDAAIATNAALGVVAPHSCGLGGDAFWLIWDTGTRTQTGLNGSGRSAAGADAEAVRAAGHDAMPFHGPHTITVPGAVRSWGDAHRRFGRLTRDAILAPAIELARGGFPASGHFSETVEGMALVAHSLGDAGAGFLETYRSQGRPWAAGEVVRQPALAATLETLAREGFDAFYDGDLGERQASALAAVGSPLRVEDLRAHRSDWTAPIDLDYRGVRVTTHPPNSSGVVALQILGILARFEPPRRSAFTPDGVADAGWIHLGLEASKLAMADRDTHLTDPGSMTRGVSELLDPGYLDELARRIDRSRAGRTVSMTRSGRDTIFLATVDADGNAVSLIESNYAGFGSGVVDADTGIAYQNRGSWFSLDPNHVNALRPRKRTLHTLLPGMLFRDGQPGPWIVAGSMGGDAQPQIHAQFVSSLVDGGQDIRTAIAAPRWYAEPPIHFAPLTDIHLEPRHPPGVADALRQMGHDLVPTGPFDSNLGHEHAIELIGGGPGVDGGAVAAATDPRSEGLPAVW